MRRKRRSPNYLIEFRFFGKAKFEMKQLIWEINRKFHIRPKHRPVPHITLVGPFKTKNQKKLVDDFKKLSQKQDILSFKVEGFDTFGDTNVVFINIKPDKKLDQFRWELSKKLRSYCYLGPYDLKREFEFHSTIAMKLAPKKFKKIKRYIDRKPKPNFKHILLRVSLIKNQKILYEYDFMLRKLLNRHEAKSRDVLSHTFDKLNQVIERTNLIPPTEIEEIDLDNISEGLFSKFVKRFRSRKIFFISDTHFDHKNIIRYCKRPFKSTAEMNKKMLQNWNKTVKSNDIVFFLGDLSFGKNGRKAEYWLKKLKGNIYYIKGNHENISRKTNVYKRLIIKYKGEKFFLVHDPKDVPPSWEGWAICGHHHNNKPVEFPLVNKKTKRINVSVELIDYTPIQFERLLEKMQK